MGEQQTYYLADGKGNILTVTNAHSSNEARKVAKLLSQEDKRKWHGGNCRIGLLKHYERKWGHKAPLAEKTPTEPCHPPYRPRTEVKMPRPVAKFPGGEIFPQTYRVQFNKEPPKGIVRSAVEWGLDAVTEIGSRVINRLFG